MCIILIVFDLSAAFDTVHHKLLHKLKHHDAFDDIMLLWFESYLTARRYYVKFGHAVSHSVTVSTGVPQGSILGPLLFILYVQDVVAIAKLHSINVCMYVDDIQCYFGFSRDMSLCAINEKIRAFVCDLNKWMNCNHLKLNQLKTSFIEFSSSRSADNCIISRIPVNACTGDVLVPSTTVKNLGVIFNGNLLFNKHVNKIVFVCCNNVRNLGRIGSKLSIPLKTQLVHSMILSHLDYYIAIFYNLPAFLVQKLTKVLFAAVRFVF